MVLLSSDNLLSINSCYWFFTYNWAEFITSNSFSIRSMGFSIYLIVSSANRDGLTLFFPVLVLFLLPVALLRTSSPVLDESGHSHLIPDLREEASSFSSFSVMLALDLLCHIWHVLCSGIFFLYLIGFVVLPWRILDFIKCLFFICWDDHMAFVLHSVDMMYPYASCFFLYIYISVRETGRWTFLF